MSSYLSRFLLLLAAVSVVAIGFSSFSFAKQPDRDADGSGTPIVKAQERVWGEYFIEYGSDRSPEGNFHPLGGTPFECGDPNTGTCEDDFRAYSVCGQNLSVEKQIENQGDWFGGDFQEYFVYKLYNSDTGTEYEAFPLTPSIQLNCKPGIHKFQKVYGGDGVNKYIGELNNHINLMPNWKGQSIEVRMDVWKGYLGNDPVDLNWKKITDAEPSDKEGSGWIKVVEQDNLGNDVEFRKAKTGVTSSDVYNLNSWMQNPLPSCTREAGTACSVSTLSFNSVSNDISTAGCNKDCPFGHYRDDIKDFSSNRDVIYDFTNSDLIRGVPYGDGENPQKDSYFQSGLAFENAARIVACGEYHGEYPKRPVYSPVDPNEPLSDGYEHDQFVCNPDTGQWESVSICNDGVDNDGDGTADLEGTYSITEFDIGGMDADNGCETLDDNSETFGGNTCQPRVGIYNGNKVAFYGQGDSYTDDISGCSYSSYQDNIPSISETEVEFTCDNNGNIVSHPVTSTSSISASELSKGDIEKKMQYSAYQACQDIAGNIDSDHNGEMKVAQVKLDEAIIPFGKKYANSAGYLPFKTETLHTAEKGKIDSSNPHDYQSYLDKNIPSSNAGSYQNPMNPSQFSDAWTVANVLAPGNPKVRQGFMPVIDSKGELVSWKIFEGGYAGNCPENRRWGYYSGEWQCLPSNYNVPHDYVLPDVEESQENLVGLKMLNSTFKKFYRATGSQLDGVEGECWRGEAGERPSDAAAATDATEFKVENIARSSLSETLQKELDQGTFNITVKGVPTSSSGKYTCAWNLTDTKGTKYEGGDLFEPRNWFKNKNAAQSIVTSVNNYVADRATDSELKKIIRNKLLPQEVPDYSSLNEISQLPDRVKVSFFKQEGISQ